MSQPFYLLLDLRKQDRPELLEAFTALYQRTFRDSSEREDPAQWIDRLHKHYPSPQPRFHILVAFEEKNRGKQTQILGGLVFEFYRNSECGLLTYLAVDPAYRRYGLGKELINTAIGILKKDAEEKEGASLRAVFSETEDPEKVGEYGNAMSPKERLMAFRRLGAFWIDIPYVQPSLEEGSGRCRHLLLLAFYAFNETPQKIEGAVIQNFLYEFYQALGVGHPESDVDFLSISRHLGNAVPLKSLPHA
jgi:GNAT superfamily N-acetyltransferase